MTGTPDRPDLICSSCGSSKIIDGWCRDCGCVYVRRRPIGERPPSADRPDLAALADRLDWQAEQWEALGPLFDTAADTTAERTAARILRAVAAAPGLRCEWEGLGYPDGRCHACMPCRVADACGES